MRSPATSSQFTTAARMSSGSKNCRTMFACTLPPRRKRSDSCRGAVRQQNVPVPVEDERRIGLLMLEDELDRSAHLRQLRRVQRGLGVLRRVSRGHQQRVALAQRHVERVGEPRDHVATRLRFSRFDAAEMARRHLRLEREIELAQAPRRAPFAQQYTHGNRGR